uniref:Uncharacterized protein n=1 Tax=Oncorhynchus tshawytscha TaxID=74940 RepID=A0AAZ3PXB9_ONCTS
MPRVPAHLCECALGMLQGGMRTADVARAINCNVRTVRRLRQRYRETGQTADRPCSGRPRVTTPAQDRYIRTSHLWDKYRMRTTTARVTRVAVLSHMGVMVGFAFIVEGMNVTQRPVLWSGIDLEVEVLSWSGEVCPRIIGLSLLSLQAILTLCVTGKTSSLMWYPSCRLILT